MRKTIEERVVTLEQQMIELRDLPAQVTGLRSDFSQLRTEMRGEFSAIRGELGESLAAVRGEMTTGFTAVRDEMAAFRADMIARDEETRRHARVLHEDAIARLAVTREGGPRSTRTRKRR